MTDKQILHEKLRDLLGGYSDDVRAQRSTISMVGHALIELGLLTSIECGYENCKMPTREFVRDNSKHGGGRLWISLDHVVEVCDGGTDMPSNLQLMHIGCNCAKGALAYHADPKRKAEHAEISRKRWEDPEYRERVTMKVAEASTKHEVLARRSASMKKNWERPEVRARRNRKFACNSCGYVSTLGWITRHQKETGHKGSSPVERIN